MSGVSLRHVSKMYGSVQALDDVSLDLAPGELVALLGPSGCGKTTLLRSVAGLERPDRGEIVIGDDDVSQVPTRQRPIGMVFQSYALFPNMTVRQNIGFPLLVRRRPADQIERKVAELLELVHLSDQANRYPNQISGGQQQRAALARALAPDPAVLLLDEPLSALDALVRVRLRDEIRRVQQAVGTTALYVTHDQAEAMAIADRVAVMNHGKIEQVSRAYDLYESPATRFSAMFVGGRNVVELPIRGGVVTLGAAFSVAAPADGNGKALAFFRPEDVELLNGEGGEPALVDGISFQGAITRVHLALQAAGTEAHIVADLPSREVLTLARGMTVTVRIDAHNVRTFATDGHDA